ncbi:MAG: TonB-dependent receptor [Acidobacteriota bacterium]
MSHRVSCVAVLVFVTPLVAFAQSGSQPPATPVFTLPPVIVTAQKEPANPQQLPVSVTAVARDTLESAGITMLGDAAPFAPNIHFSELSARKVSNIFVRGIGSSPANPGITTYIDGVPQLNSISSSVELVDVERIEFVRGPQSALFGRNALGGVVNVVSGRPSLAGWTGRVSAPFGSASLRDVRGVLSGPVSHTLAIGLAGGWSARDGYTRNDVAGHLLDSRSAVFGRLQLLWVPAPEWEARLMIGGERARDGDYALNDLDELRRTPFHVSRDFEGWTRRDVWSATASLRREGRRVAFSSTTGLVGWTTRDMTDLDYSALPLVTRDNAEDDRQFTQEFRVASSAGVPLRLSDRLSLRWQAGVFVFTQDYAQNAVNAFSPFVLSNFVPFAVRQHAPLAVLDDWGVGVYGQGTLDLGDRLDLTAGLRADREHKAATLDTFLTPAIAPPVRVEADKTFVNLSPQFAVTCRIRPEVVAYASAGRGFKAGGFNPASPPGRESYGEEQTWSLEGGLKMVWAGGRVTADAAVFHIDWDGLQMNLPSPQVPAPFYIANVGGARSTGLELEVHARPHANVDLYSAAGVTHARFGAGSASGGVDVAGNTLPNSPGYTFSLGTHVARSVGTGARIYARADAIIYGSYYYDEANREGQDAYSLVNARVGIGGARLSIEGWVKNAFDTRYVPVAFAYGGLTPSGFLGEMGPPRTFGISAGIAF